MYLLQNLGRSFQAGNTSKISMGANTLVEVSFRLYDRLKHAKDGQEKNPY